MGTRMDDGLPCAELWSCPSRQQKLTLFLGLDERDNSSIANWKYQLIVVQWRESSFWLCVALLKSLILPSPEATDLCLREPSWAINHCNCSLSRAPTAPLLRHHCSRGTETIHREEDTWRWLIQIFQTYTYNKFSFPSWNWNFSHLKPHLGWCCPQF